MGVSLVQAEQRNLSQKLYFVAAEEGEQFLRADAKGRCPVQFEGTFLQDSGPQSACLARILNDVSLTSLTGTAVPKHPGQWPR